ncbi:MAG: hypothetical protein QOE93_589 [Actinomycetota bacterium]|jgi:hypothetical protein|nr:hypothetical protein [Actinomycetota bacterium]
MTRRILTFLLTFVIAALGLTLRMAPPALAAGEGKWTATACYAEMPYNGAWLGTPGLGASYSSVLAQYDVPLQWITWSGKGQSYIQLVGGTHAYYAAAGYECGRFGLPFSAGLYQTPLLTFRWTFFVKPGDCNLRYIVQVYGDGLTFEGATPRYFC